jgi:hypothetical protein
VGGAKDRGMETGWGARAGGSDEWDDAGGLCHGAKMA